MQCISFHHLQSISVLYRLMPHPYDKSLRDRLPVNVQLLFKPNSICLIITGGSRSHVMAHGEIMWECTAFSHILQNILLSYLLYIIVLIPSLITARNSVYSCSIVKSVCKNYFTVIFIFSCFKWCCFIGQNFVQWS